MNDNEILTIVGIGASAGGLDPLQSFIKKIKPSENITYVITQHLDKHQPTKLLEILSRSSTIPISMAMDDEIIEANRIYICPPKYNLTIENNRFKLITPSSKDYSVPSINKFFTSLAKQKEDKAIGIILSGAGNDGSEGIKDIKLAGGITIAQEETTAKHPEMPSAAIKTKHVDLILSPENMAVELQTILKYPLILYKEDYGKQLDKIFDILLDKTNTDFSDYKISTIQRRIKRRMVVTKKKSLDDYIDYLKISEKEVKLLQKELLVIVTSFFRDEEAFIQLEKSIEKLVQNKNKYEPIRVWITGCATGEEAYSVAIILYEALKRNNLSNKIQIFATDISSEAIKVARDGSYDINSVKNIKQNLLKEYFIKKDDTYKISKDIRDIIIFSKHDMIKDPPFLNMDLITCRNLLIYFNSELQKRIFSIFFNALNTEGILFLGKSENTTNITNLFVSIDNKWKIFKKDKSSTPPTLDNMTYYPKRYVSGLSTVKKRFIKKKDFNTHLHNSLAQTILDKYFDTYIIINRENNIIYTKGELSDYIKFPKGGFTQELFSFLKDSIRVDIRTAILKARREQEIVSFGIKLDGLNLRIDIIPIRENEIATEGICIVFKQNKDEIVIENNKELVDKYNRLNIQELEQELIETKERLQTTIEELETSNEELQSTNEEFQSSNEELQSTNEELETSNEELQSTNEELTTVNQELERKSKELRISNKDLENTFDSISYGVMILDTDLKIRKYTSFMETISTISSKNICNELSSIPMPIESKFLNKKIKEVMKSGEETKFEKKFKNMDLLITIKPYLGEKNEIRGSILSFHDITKIKENEEELKRAKYELEHINDNLEHIIDEKTLEIKVINRNLEEKNKTLTNALKLFENTFEQAAVGIAHVSLNGDWLKVNQKLCDILSYTKEELLDLTFQDITYPDDLDRDLEYVNQLLTGEIENYSLNKRYYKKDKSIVWINLTASLVRKTNKEPDFFIAVIEDISLQKEYQEKLKSQKEEFETIFNFSHDSITIVDLKTNFLKFNKAFLEMTGYTEDELITKSCNDLTAPEDISKNQGAMEQAILTGHANNIEKSCLTKDNKMITVNMSASLLPDKDKILLSLKDISSIKIMEQQSRLASMGEMIGNIAHQWRQPLSVITTSISGLKLKSDLTGLKEEDIDECEENIIKQANYLSTTIDNFRNFLKGEKFITQISIKNVIKNSLSLIEASLHNNYINLFLDLEDDLKIDGNINELSEALINILNNSKDILKNEIKDENDRLIFITTKKVDINSLELKILDSGGGINSSIIDKIFEPYFTTKHQYQGTGLGLSISHKIITQRYHGEIKASNHKFNHNGKDYKGACFTIIFKDEL
ncbi:CheR family methyltransferase [Halarcobacter sp.]|uniref:CheR family methyltransferase n=1 Tax=Halarcobacter sp. TaxID=2321133 RepID=UPI002AA9232B|nr:CheR family methyltransferase [Halarcobacter sp.]